METLLRNLHFSYVFLQRAFRKASSYLYDYEIRTGNIVEENGRDVVATLVGFGHFANLSASLSVFDETLMFWGEVEAKCHFLQTEF